MPGCSIVFTDVTENWTKRPSGYYSDRRRARSLFPVLQRDVDSTGQVQLPCDQFYSSWGNLEQLIGRQNVGTKEILDLLSILTLQQ